MYYMVMMKKRGDAEICSSASRNKKAKSLIEKRRRARINGCLEELKSIVVKSKSDSMAISKLEKADILEMTVHYLKEYKQHGKTNTPCKSKAYVDGYTTCANAVLNFFEKTKSTDNQSKTLSQTDALQAWMEQQMRQTEGMKQTEKSDMYRDENVITEDVSNVVCHSVEMSDDNVSNRPRDTNQSESNLRARMTDIPVSHSKSDMSLSQGHFPNTLHDVREEIMFSSEKCDYNKECRYVGLPASSSSDMETSTRIRQDQMTKTSEHVDTGYQVALLLPPVYQNHSLVPLYGVIIPNTSNVIKSTESSYKERRIDEHKLDGIPDSGANLHQDLRDCGIQDNTNCCYSSCGATKLNENSNNSVYKSYCVSDCLAVDDNNNFTQANLQMSKTTMTESKFGDTDQERQMQYSLTREDNMDLRCQSLNNSHVYPSSSTVWRPW